MTALIELRDHGIYALADGNRFVARPAHQGTYGLYDPRLGIAHPPVHTISSAGEILSWGAPTGWHIEDLSDTGETSPPLDLRELTLL